MEYVTKNWVQKATVPITYDELVTADGDSILYHPWLIIKFLKLKFYELKGFDTTAPQADFMRVFQSMSGKSKGAPVLSLTPYTSPVFIGPWSIPDGSWSV
jgi:hypothetical protein